MMVPALSSAPLLQSPRQHAWRALKRGVITDKNNREAASEKYVLDTQINTRGACFEGAGQRQLAAVRGRGSSGFGAGLWRCVLRCVRSVWLLLLVRGALGTQSFLRRFQRL
ncbi:hypothetical protein F7725_025261 [Dissostichus mawsoni]|uniref:Uncharacterized protein n=1 Tax=Dissostichus mawsoni TaxID=36200 RepID=A0A7J5XBS5_DISMA|nr:hypothetical protein F7725_025261 [Dissostichus mawsoni]